MAWPSLTRGVWSYIISKLGIFTDVNPSKLELSATSVKLNDVSIDPAKLSTSDIVISEFIIGNLVMELNASGISVSASNVTIIACVESLSSPDAAISMFLESTRDNLDRIESEIPVASDESSASTSQNTNTMTSRLADMILAQISVHASNVTFVLTIADDKEVIVSIEEALMPKKNRIEIESVTVNTNMLGDYEDIMTKSIFLEADTPFTHSGGSELATINRIVINYDPEALTFDADVDYVRLDGLGCLQLLVVCLNEIVFQNDRNGQLNTRAPSSNLNEEDGAARKKLKDLKFFIEKVHILDSWDSSAPPLSLSQILIGSEQMKIETLSIPGILHATPFVTVRYSSLLELTWEVPLSINIPLDHLSALRHIANRVKALLTSLNPPEDPEPEPMNVFLPELRISVGDDLTFHLFPHRVTEIGINIREILITAGDGQVLIGDIYLSFMDGLVVDKVRARLTSLFLEQIDLIRHALYDDDDQDGDSFVTDEEDTDDINDPLNGLLLPTDPLNGLLLSNISINLRSIMIEGVNSLNIRGALDVQQSDNEVSMSCQFSGRYNNFSGSIEMTSRSSDQLRSIDTDLHVKQFDINLKQLLQNSESMGEDVSLPESLAGTCWPRMSFNVSLDEAILRADPLNIMVKTGTTKILLDSFLRISCTIPSLNVDIEDPSLPKAYIPILKASELSLSKQYLKLSVTIGNLALGSCADSFASLTRILEMFAPPQKRKLQFKVEADLPLDIFDEVFDTEFISTNVSTPSRFISGKSLGKLDIRDNYLNDLSKRSTGSSPKSSWQNADHIYTCLNIEIKRAQWQLFDGFDFESSRNAMQDTIKRVSKAAEMLNKDDSDDSDNDEKAIVGDFMYQSMIITAMPATAKDLRETVAKELGSTADFARSMEPKIVLSLRKTKAVRYNSINEPDSHFSLTIKDGKVSDLVNTSKFKHLLSPEGKAEQNVVNFTQDVVGPEFAPEIRASLFLRPLKLCLDQDTLEFMNRFFQFSPEDDERDGQTSDLTEELLVSTDESPGFIQRFEFGGLPLTIDYKPRKLDYRSLRSGTAAELLNIFAVKGAKLMLPANILHGINGWDYLFAELLELWLPDIRANQLGGLISGISPVRRAIKVGKGVGQYTMVPLKKTQISRGATVVVRKTIEELLRYGASWLDSTDNVLSG